ncbi:hypothetical protein TNCV_3308471 [Trichonephila clavipes]|nr:hypothetical protein TNCV_3308471 [Trichonephila clavipes]
METQLVLLKDTNTKPLDWPRGRILEVFPGSDGLVRVVNVKTSTGILKRAITKLSGYGHELVAGVSWARVLLLLNTRRVDDAIPPADVVVKKDWYQLRCPPRHLTEVQNYEVCDQ